MMSTTTWPTLPTYAIAIAAALLVTATPVNAQTAEEDAEAAARAVLEGISEGNVDLLMETMHPEGFLLAVPDQGAPRRQELDAFFESLRGSEGRYLERMWEATVLVDGPIASVWAPYDFHIDGQFSHCGTDTFQLVLEEDRWRVLSVIYTMHRGDACSPSPLGPPPGSPGGGSEL